MSQNSCMDVMGQLRAGESGAATQVFERFAHRLVTLARNRLNLQLRQKVDPEDIAQSVFKSFFRKQGQESFTIEDWNGLWGLLVTMTMRKCNRQAERFYAARRDVRQETSGKPASADSEFQWDPEGSEPTPEQSAILAETVETVMKALDERGRQVFILRLQGYTIPEISAQIDRTERTVHRTLDRIREELESLTT
jgi:RNA polymerase sigma-70 factor, ECF subfamily